MFRVRQKEILSNWLKFQFFFMIGGVHLIKKRGNHLKDTHLNTQNNAPNVALF